MSAEPLRAAIRALASGMSLSADETAAAFDVVMRGEAKPAQVAALLMALRVKGETAEEVTGGARALRSAMVHLPAEDPLALVDTCGTGGGVLQTFNISTAAALLAAGAGVRVAKHGNRSYTTKCGSADVLEALGVRIEMPVEAMRRTLADAGIVFMFAPAMHPAMRHVGPVRGDIGVPTIMNILGPLANPAGAGRQVVGVAEEARLSVLAHALAALGSVHALVVHGMPGIDEVSPLGITRVLEVRNGTVREWTIDPHWYGLQVADAAEIAGATPEANAEVILRVLRNEEHGGARAAVLLNAAAALYVSARAPSYADALRLAGDALEAGAGLAALERLRRGSG
ncbi:MAG TPA: anthranilate phosphoribosyltransferase [Gemmatimonadaceae bacterium]|nr:anthranilate phosphoribosyltransferase [Gemmatimonadaceae bacterium]